MHLDDFLHDCVPRELHPEDAAVLHDAPGVFPYVAVDELCLGHIARFKRPREYRFVEALPKNNYGKVLKTELRRLARA